jgi:hypothetical protein
LNRKLRLAQQRAAVGRTEGRHFETVGRASRFLQRTKRRRGSEDFATLQMPSALQVHSDTELTLSDAQLTQYTLKQPESVFSDASISPGSPFATISGDRSSRYFYEANKAGNIPNSVSGSAELPGSKLAAPSTPSSSTSNLSVFDKKRLFLKFHKLVQKSNFTSGNQQDVYKMAKFQSQKIHKYVKCGSLNPLTVADFKCLFDDAHQKEWLRFLECYPQEFISERDLRGFLERIYLDRFELTTSIQNMESAVKKIDIVLTGCVLLINVLIVAISFGSGLQTIVSMSSLLFSAGFMFQSSAKNALESILFLFVIHPFDVGDRVYIQLSSPTDFDNLVVSEMHLLSTVFERWDGVKVYVPNYVLAMKSIINIRRSGSICETHRLQVGYQTSTDQLNIFRHVI